MEDAHVQLRRRSHLETGDDLVHAARIVGRHRPGIWLKPRCRSQERCSIRSSLEAGGVEATSTKEESG